MRVLLLAVRKVKAGKGKIALCAIQPQVREVFDIRGLSSVFAIPSRARRGGPVGCLSEIKARLPRLVKE